MSREWFNGPLAALGETLVKDDARKLIELPELLRPTTLDRLLLQVYGAELMTDQLPVLVSQWFKFYAMQVIAPVVVASLAHGKHWPLRLDQLSFALDERGVLDGVRFSCSPVVRSESTDPFECFAPLLDNLAQVIERLSTYGGLAPRVLWSSAGDYLETCLRRLSSVSDVSLAPGYGLLREPLMPDGQRNPLFASIIYIEGSKGQTVRQRRNCCLSYRVAWVGRCEHCPLQHASHCA